VIFGRLQGAPGSTVDATSDALRAVETYYAGIPSGGLQRRRRLPDGRVRQRHPAAEAWEERERRQQDIARELNQKFATLPG